MSNSLTCPVCEEPNDHHTPEQDYSCQGVARANHDALADLRGTVADTLLKLEDMGWKPEMAEEILLRTVRQVIRAGH